MEIILIQILVTGFIIGGLFLLIYWLIKRKKFLKQFSFNKRPVIDDFEELLSSSFYKSYSKDFSGAIDDINKALKLKPHMERLYFQRAKLREELKDYEAAKADYTKAILLKNNYDVAYLNRGLIKLKQKDYVGAKKDLIKAQQLNGNLNEAGFFRREAEMHITKLDEHQKDIIDLFDSEDTSQKGKAL
ncbi:tpr repeat [hydrocarbon metagenome]|uniref:Tpr repeat n=1 Tax=hydrocarbon metagenome TaxID=938273 RepID=A0A0W8G0Z3_9ZZZZ